jgi:hypothetical protein
VRSKGNSSAMCGKPVRSRFPPAPPPSNLVHRVALLDQSGPVFPAFTPENLTISRRDRNFRRHFGWNRDEGRIVRRGCRGQLEVNVPPTDLVTVVVTARERFSSAFRCLPVLLENTQRPFQLVYVAGGAPAYVRAYLTDMSERHGFHLILPAQILTPNQHRNLALQSVKTRYVVFVDNDVLVEPGWLEALVDCAEETGGDLVGPLCLFGEPRDGLVHSTGGKLRVKEANGVRLLEEEQGLTGVCLRTRQIDLQRHLCDFVEFHCVLIRRDLFERVGPLDEEFVTAEHVDLALLVQSVNGRVYTEPSAVVSYLAEEEFVVADGEFFRRRWSDDWNQRTLDRLAAKWQLERHSPQFLDYESYLRRQQEACPWRRSVPRLPSGIRADQHPFAQTIQQLLNQLAGAGFPAWNISVVRETYALAEVMFAGMYRSTGKTVLAHMVGTASVLAAHGATLGVLQVALLHAAYTFGRFPDTVGELDAMRRWLLARIGFSVEGLLWEWTRLDIAVVEPQVLQPDLDQLPINIAFGVLVHIANSIDEHLDWGLLHSTNVQEVLSKNTAQDERWRAVHQRVVERMGFSPMLDLLDSVAAQTREKASIPMPFADPLGARAVSPGSLSMVSLVRRRITPRVPADAWGPIDPSVPQAQQWRRNCLGPLIQEISLEGVVAQNQGVVFRKTDSGPEAPAVGAENGVTIQTDPTQWSYSATVPVKPAPDSHGPAILQVRLRVERGEIGLGLLREGSSTEFVVPEQSQAMVPSPVELLIPILELREVGVLVFRSWARSGEPSLGHLHTLALFHVLTREDMPELGRGLT